MNFVIELSMALMMFSLGLLCLMGTVVFSSYAYKQVKDNLRK